MSENGADFRSGQRNSHGHACTSWLSMSGMDVNAHDGRNWICKSDESQFEIYVLHWSGPSELKWKWLFMNGCKCKSPIYTSMEFFKMGQMHQCVEGLCCKIMIHQWNKWATANIVMTSNLILLTWGTLLIEHLINESVVVVGIYETT
jgi:hypothetical protein